MGAVRKAVAVEETAGAAFLGVTSSVRGLVWRDRLDAAGLNAAIAISQRHDLPELLGRVLAARGIGLEEVPVVLDPTIKALMPDPSTVRDMDKGAASPRRRHRAARGHRRVRRLRCRRRGVRRADAPLPGRPRPRAPHLHPRPHDRGLRPQRGGDRGARRRRRPPHRHRRLRHRRHRRARRRRPPRRRRHRRRPPPGRRAPARRCRRHQSQPPGRPLGPRAPVRGGRHLHAAGGDRRASCAGAGSTTTPARRPIS